MRLFYYFLKKDITVFFIKNNNTYVVFFFYLLLILLFSIGIGPNLNLLSDISVSIIWNIFFISLILSIELFFFRDYENKFINIVKLRPKYLLIYFLSKSMSHWIVNTVPIIFNVPLFLVLLNINLNLIKIVIPIFILSSFSLSFFGLLSSVLISCLRQKGILISFILMPVYIPNLIFSMETINLYIHNETYIKTILFLIINLIVSMIFIPYISSYIIKNHHF